MARKILVSNAEKKTKQDAVKAEKDKHKAKKLNTLSKSDLYDLCHAFLSERGLIDEDDVILG